MATMADIVRDALRKATVTAHDEPPTAEQMANGLNDLNAMMHGWALRGVDLAHTDLAASATFPLADEFREGTVYLLASRIKHDYNAPPTFDADDWFRGIQAAYMEIEQVTFDRALSVMPSQRRRLGVDV